MALEVDIKKNFPDFKLQIRFKAEQEILVCWVRPAAVKA